MKQLRRQIDGIDKEVIKLLGRRMKLVLKLGKLKKKEGAPVQDKKRETEMLKKLEKQAKKLGLDVKFVNKIYKDILKESRKIQTLTN